MKPIFLLAASACCTLVTGCAGMRSEVLPAFPPEAQALDAQALKARLSGRSFTVYPPSGGRWDTTYAADSRFTLRLPSGVTGVGRWRTEEGSRVCVDYERDFPSGCSEVREKAGQLYLKRGATGEVFLLEPRS